jgi:HPt (histidine-containing phosphotransfer) domain-containing protein
MNDKALINLDYLRKLSRGDDKFVDDIIALFIKNTPSAIQKMKNHYQNQKWDDLMMEAHKIRPSFNFLGLKELEDAAKTIENLASEKSNIEQIGELINKIDKTIALVLIELKSELKITDH